MNIPQCPNHKEGVCERSELRLLGENETSFLFTCACCHLFWSVSKDKTKQGARYENQLRRVKEATERERQLSKMPKTFYNPTNYGRART